MRSKVTVKDIVGVMEEIAPASLAEPWDNVGLQIGHVESPVSCIWIALDPVLDVVSRVCSNGADLLITHHPLVFQPLRAIDTGTATGKIIQMAIQHQLAILAAHTNLDSATGGLNDALGQRIGLKNLEVLVGADTEETYKLVVFVPPHDEEKLLDALFKADAGKIDDYTCCSFRVYGKGTFKPGSASNPSLGKVGRINHVEEIRIETVVKKNHISAVIEQLKACHSYETMAYDIYPLRNTRSNQGLGRIGELVKSLELSAFAEHLKKVLKIESVKVVGNPEMKISRVAICTGSGSGLMSSFFSSRADVYVSGDLRYHDARAAEAEGRAMIDIGHFASEHLMIDVLADKLQNILTEKEIDIKVNRCKIEKEPFKIF